MEYKITPQGKLKQVVCYNPPKFNAKEAGKFSHHPVRRILKGLGISDSAILSEDNQDETGRYAHNLAIQDPSGLYHDSVLFARVRFFVTEAEAEALVNVLNAGLMRYAPHLREDTAMNWIKKKANRIYPAALTRRTPTCKGCTTHCFTAKVGLTIKDMAQIKCGCNRHPGRRSAPGKLQGT